MSHDGLNQEQENKSQSLTTITNIQANQPPPPKTGGGEHFGSTGFREYKLQYLAVIFLGLSLLFLIVGSFVVTLIDPTKNIWITTEPIMGAILALFGILLKIRISLDAKKEQIPHMT